MNRKEEFMELKDELEQTPAQLEYTAVKAIAKAKKSKRRSIFVKTPLISFCSIAVLFVGLVNLFPAAALAMSNVPVLKELVHAVAFDPSLKAAVEHEYYQVIGESQTQEDVTVTVDYMILDAGHISLFFSVDAPVKAGTWHYDFRDTKGNGLAAAIGFDTMYEVGKMEVISIDFSDINDMPEEFTFTVTVNKDENFKEWKEASIPADGSSPTGYAEEKPVGKDYTFRFRLQPDKQFVQTVTAVPINKWIEIMNQRIYLKSLDIYPTEARLYLDYDDTNSAVLNGMKVYFEDDKGNRYETKKNGVSAFYEPDSQNVAILNYESSYFSAADHLTLYIEGVTLVEKDKLYGEIDNSTKTITNLPEGVCVEAMTLKDTTLNITLKSVSDEESGYRQLISFEYYDTAGVSYNLGEMSTDTENGNTYKMNFQIKNYEDHKYKVNWIYAPMQTFEFPITVKLK